MAHDTCFPAALLAFQ